MPGQKKRKSSSKRARKRGRRAVVSTPPTGAELWTRGGEPLIGEGAELVTVEDVSGRKWTVPRAALPKPPPEGARVFDLTKPGGMEALAAATGKGLQLRKGRMTITAGVAKGTPVYASGQLAQIEDSPRHIGAMAEAAALAHGIRDDREHATRQHRARSANEHKARKYANRNAALRKRFEELLREGLAKNWSEKRARAEAVRSLAHAHNVEDEQIRRILRK